MYRVCLITVWVLLSSPAFSAAPLKQLDRYSVMDTAPIAERYDIMQDVITVPFDASIKTVGHAVLYLLKRSGYRLASFEASHPSMPILLDSPLPDIHRTIGPLTLYDALAVLAGQGWVPVTDPIHRLVSFEVDSHYQVSSQ